MLAKILKDQTFYRNEDNLRIENYSLLTEVPNTIENYNDMYSDIQKPTSDSKILISPKQNKSSLEITKSANNEQILSNVTPNFVENIAPLLFDDKNNLDKYDSLVFHLTKNLLTTPKLDKSFTQLIKTSCNSEDTLKFPGAFTLARQNVSHEKLLKKKLHSFWGEMIQRNASLNALAEERLFNKHFASKRRAQAMEMRTRDMQEWLNDVPKKDFMKQPQVPALDFMSKENDGNRKLNLLCVFTNEADYKETCSDFNKMGNDEDIRIILPMTRNIVVASNVLTISDDHNQHITIFFRNPLKAKFDYKYSNPFSGRKFRFRSSMDPMSRLKERVQSSRMRRLNSLTINQIEKPFNWQNNKTFCKSPTLGNENKIGSDSFLLLHQPILLNCKVQNKTKQVLMYKAQSVQNNPKNARKKDFSSTIQELLDRSIQYEGENVHLVLDPLKLVSRPKEEGKTNSLIQSNYCKCKHNFINSYIYKKLLQYRNSQMLGDTNYENKTFRTLLPKNGCMMQEKNINEVLDKCAIQENTPNEMSGKSIITTDSCLDLPKNFTTRRNLDMDELIGENRLKMSWRMSRTALKQINAKQVVSSVFRHFFHFYSLLGGNLRSGTVITKSGSNFWLKVAGVATDSCTLRFAGDLFTAVAGKKVVLNIFDYIRFLVMFARTRRLIIQEVVKQMMGCKQLSEPVFIKEKCKKCTSLKNREIGSTKFYDKENYLSISRSLPNMWSPKVCSNQRNRSCFSQEIF